MKTIVLTLLVALSLACAAVVFAQAPVSRVPIESVKWDCKPENLGFCEAHIEGDPAKAGYYVIFVKFPASGLMSKPHFHDETRYATVIKGTWWTGEGDVFDPSKTVALKPGSFMKHPGKTHHFDGSKNEEVILQLAGVGPSTTTRMKPNEGLFAPSNPAPAKK
jgi:hypothetical protein